MTRKEDKNTRLINGLSESSQGGNGRAVLHEIVNLLQQLLNEDEPSHIDLRALPLSQTDIELLVEVLGEGDGYAELFDYGITRIRQTGIPGVWWVVHMDDEEQVISELIEINYTPEALIATVEDVKEGREALRARLFEVDMARKMGR